MIPPNLHPLFWDVNLDGFDPRAHPEYTIARVLELGDEDAVDWMRREFPESRIISVLRSDRRLSRKSANFWAIVFGVPAHEVAALERP